MSDQVLETNKKLKTAFANPPPGFFFSHNFLNEKILFFSEKEKLLLSAYKGQVVRLSYDKWAARIPKTPIAYDFLEDDPKKILILYLDNQKQSSQELLKTLFHEGFHGFVQTRANKWQTQDKDQSRGRLYPIQSLPRYFRWEMQQALLSYFDTKKELHLQHFSYWHWKWRRQFVDEYKNYTDREEATAEYFTQKMMALVAGQNSTHSAFFKYYRSTPLGQSNLKLELNQDHESYHLGPLIGMALDNTVGPGWQDEVRKGSSPFDVLEKKFPRKKAPQRLEEKKEFLRLTVREMYKMDPKGDLDRLISDLAHPKTLRLVLPAHKARSSSFAARDIVRPFFRFKDLKNVTFIALASPFVVQTDQWKWTFSETDYLVKTLSNPCSHKNSYVVLLQKNDVELSKGQLILKDKSQAPLKVRTKKKGVQQWYCAQ